MASTPELRAWWKKYECKEELMKPIDFLGDRIRVAPETVEAFGALADVMKAHGYKVRKKDTGSYNCRNIGNSNKKSLHSYGIAVDVNWNTNPWKDHPGKREVVFSDKPSQKARAQDVLDGLADTDMSPGMVADIIAIRTVEGKTVFEWGGMWNTVKDSMHFEIDVAPAHLVKGLDDSTIVRKVVDQDQPLPEPKPTFEVRPIDEPDDHGGSGVCPMCGHEHGPDAGPGADAKPLPLFKVIARSGLRLRSGPGIEFDKIGLLPSGSIVAGLGREGAWMLVSRDGDDQADGHAHSAYLRAVEPAMSSPVAPDVSVTPTKKPKRKAEPKPAPANPAMMDITPEQVATIFHPSARHNVITHWEFVRDGLNELKLLDPEMLAMALGTIKAETASFRPISEGKSRFNTRATPFDLYDAGTSIGRRLGNTVPGDGPKFKGRGFVQLTGRFNYTKIGKQIDVDLAGNPDLANDPKVAGEILARFLKNKESAIRNTLHPAAPDMRAARRLVNGGSHGLANFTEAYHASRAKFG